MKLDTFVKVTLVVIALFLGIIALRPFFEIGSAMANPSGKFDYVQALAGDYSPQIFILFDSRTGDIWAYRDSNAKHVGRLVELGKPLEQK